MGPRDLSMVGGIIFIGVFYLYLFNPAVKAFAESTNEYFQGADVQLQYAPPLSILDMVGMTLCCVQYRQSTQGPKSWFETLVSSLMMQLGGTTLSGLLLGQVPGWMMGDSTFCGCLLVWWLTFFCPLDLYWRFLHCSPAVLLAFNFIGVFSCGHGVTSWGMDKALFNSFHVNASDISQSFIACILAGTLANSGGGLVCDQLGFTKRKSYTLSDTPPLLKLGNYQSSRGVNNSFLMAFAYYIMVNTRSFLGLDFRLPIRTAHALITLAQFYVFFVELLAPDLDVCQTFSNTCLDAVGVTRVVDFSNHKRSKESKEE
jgi:uncharacterized membrane protein YeiH